MITSKHEIRMEAAADWVERWSPILEAYMLERFVELKPEERERLRAFHRELLEKGR